MDVTLPASNDKNKILTETGISAVQLPPLAQTYIVHLIKEKKKLNFAAKEAFGNVNKYDYITPPLNKLK